MKLFSRRKPRGDYRPAITGDINGRGDSEALCLSIRALFSSRGNPAELETFAETTVVHETSLFCLGHYRARLSFSRSDSRRDSAPKPLSKFLSLSSRMVNSVRLRDILAAITFRERRSIAASSPRLPLYRIHPRERARFSKAQGCRVIRSAGMIQRPRNRSNVSMMMRLL